MNHRRGASRAVVPAALAAVAAALIATGCGGGSEPKDVVLVTHDSFAVSKPVKQAFERESGLTLKILQGGDANEVLNRALLTAGDPQGDVVFGIDDSVVSRALAGDLLEQYRSPELSALQPDFVNPIRTVTPIDHGEVCLNVDRRLVRLAQGVSADDARRPDPRPLPEPARRREPGDVVSRAGVPPRDRRDVRRPGWETYWRAPRERRAGRRRLGGGVHAAVLRRLRQPRQAADRRVVRIEPRRGGHLRVEAAPTAPAAAVEEGCYRQVEYAGVLRGAHNEDGAHELIDFMLSERFQVDVPAVDVRLPGAGRRAAARRVREIRDRSARPAATAGGRGRREPRPLGRPVDRDRRDAERRRSRRRCSVPVAFLAVFFAWPLAAILQRSLVVDGRLDLPFDVLTDSTTREVAWFTLWQATVSTALTLVAGLPLAWALSRGSGSAGRSVRGAGPRAVRAPDGGGRDRVRRAAARGVERSVSAILLAHVFFNVAVVVRIVGGFWAGLDPPLGDAAATLGARPWPCCAR